MKNIPLSLYVHFPWCVQKCPYCDFNSHATESREIPESAYLNALIADLDSQLEGLEQSLLTSIFIGGGTPSLISPQGIDFLLNKIAARLTINDIEITMEANPGTFDQSNFDGYAKAGVNRLSIGVQSFSNTMLQGLGRAHNSDEILKAYEGARRAGFRRINLDLMHGLENQSVDMALADLETAVSLEPEHISWYELTIEPNTVFYSKPPKIPEDEVLEEMTRNGLAYLSSAGYQQYEVSAFSKVNEASLHNLNYWQFGDYLGIGAGAHGKITETTSAGFRISRTQKTRVPKDYLTHYARTQIKPVPPEEVSLEFLMNAFRLTNGFNLSLFYERTGLPVESLQAPLAAGVAKGWIRPIAKGQIKLTPLGQTFLNTVLTELAA